MISLKDYIYEEGVTPMNTMGAGNPSLPTVSDVPGDVNGSVPGSGDLLTRKVRKPKKLPKLKESIFDTKPDIIVDDFAKRLADEKQFDGAYDDLLKIMNVHKLFTHEFRYNRREKFMLLSFNPRRATTWGDKLRLVVGDGSKIKLISIGRGGFSTRKPHVVQYFDEKEDFEIDKYFRTYDMSGVSWFKDLFDKLFDVAEETR